MLARQRSLAAALALAGVLAGGCGRADTRDPGDAAEMTPDPPDPSAAVPGIQATNAFYYYEDLDAAAAFYTGVMGFEVVADYGFARILRVAPESYLTLVDAAEGMHGTDEPKSVTLALVTDEVEGWHAYLTARGVPTLGEYAPTAGSPHDGFVAVDPEGYYLEIERFNRHPENTALLPLLEAAEPLGPAGGDRPTDLGVRATVLWLYYEELEPLQRFWEHLLGVELAVDQGWAKVYPVSPTGYLGLVDGARGLHEATDEKAVTVSFLTRTIDAWHRRAVEQELELRGRGITEERTRVRTFVAFDPGGYFLEWDTFLPVPDNDRLLDLLPEG